MVLPTSIAKQGFHELFSCVHKGNFRKADEQTIIYFLLNGFLSTM